MSVIAVKKMGNKIVIWSDQQVTWGFEEKHTSNTPCKLHKCWDVIFWAAWEAATVWPMKIFLETYEPKKLVSPKDVMDMIKQFKERAKDYEVWDSVEKNNSFIFVSNDKIFSYCSWCVEEVEDFWAIWSGAMKAMACLSVWATLENSLKAVCKYDLYCSEPLVIVETLLSTTKSKCE